LPEQLPLDFNVSVSVRQRRARQAALAAQTQPTLFFDSPNLDVHLHSPQEAVAAVASDPDAAYVFLTRLFGSARQLKSRRIAFPASMLDRLLYVRPPVQVSLDAASLAVARAVWAQKLGLSPLRVSRHGSRLLAQSVRWPAGFALRDVPWTAIATLVELGVPLNIDPDARSLMIDKLTASGATIATAGLAGSAVAIDTSRPDLLESMGLPGLAYAGSPDAGRYRMPLLTAECLLAEESVRLTDELAATIRRVTGRRRPLTPPDDFPWTLYPFQARDASQAVRILEVTGGVLLAGSMGSGKTTVSLAVIEHLSCWPILVVCPLAAMSTWARQLGEMGRTFYLASEAPRVSWETIEQNNFDAVVISYDRLHSFIELIERKNFSAIVADELQRIRTAGSRRSKALRTLAQSVPLRIGLSGTPLQNRLEDLLAPGAFLVPGEFKPRASAKDLSDLYPGDPVEAVADHVGSMMVRRRMEDTGVKLPNKTVRRLYVDLTPEQRRALQDLEEEANKEKEDGQLDRMHAFAKLTRMRQIVSCPSMAGVAGPNPKVRTAVDLVEEFVTMNRKSVVFCANRRTWVELREALTEIGIRSTGIWGASSIADRITAEKQFHSDPDTKVFVGTIQSCAESLTLSPTGTVVIFCDYVYNPSDMDQAEARVYRMNQTNECDIVYLHAQASGGTLDDRMAAILEQKKQLFAQVIDRTTYENNTQVTYTLSDLVFLLTGRVDEELRQQEADKKAAELRELDKKRHARLSAHRHKNKSSDTLDDGSQAITLEQYRALESDMSALDDEDLAPTPSDDDEGFFRDDDAAPE